MTLPPEIEAEGLKAYEQARAFEALRRRGVPWFYLVFSVLLWVGFILALRFWLRDALTYSLLAGAVLFSVLSRANWMMLREKYALNLELLERLEDEYGEELPWLRIERHLAAMEGLKRELAEEGEI